METMVALTKKYASRRTATRRRTGKMTSVDETSYDKKEHNFESCKEQVWNTPTNS